MKPLTVTYWVLLTVWVLALVNIIWEIANFRWMMAYDLSFFVVGLGLGLMGRRLIVGDEVIVMQTPLHGSPATVQDGVREEVRS